MHKIITLIAVFFFTVNLHGQDINFLKDVKTAIKKSHKNKKPIFIYFAINKTDVNEKEISPDYLYSNTDIQNLFNNSFNIVLVNQGDKQAYSLSKKYNIHSFPSYLFINSKQKLIHKRIGILNSEELVLMAQKVNNKDKTLLYYQSLFKKNNNKPKEEYLDYANTLYNAGEPYQVIIDQYFSKLAVKEYHEFININAIYKYSNNIYSDEFIFFARDEFNYEELSFTNIEKTLKIEEVISQHLLDNLSKKDEKFFEDSVSSIIDFFNITNIEMLRTRVFMDYYNADATKQELYLQSLPPYVSLHQQYLSSQQIGDFAKDIYDKSNNEDLLNLAIMWLDEILSQNKNIELAYLKIQLLIKQGRQEEARDMIMIISEEYSNSLSPEWRNKMEKLFKEKADIDNGKKKDDGVLLLPK